MGQADSRSKGVTKLNHYLSILAVFVLLWRVSSTLALTCHSGVGEPANSVASTRFILSKATENAEQARQMGRQPDIAPIFKLSQVRPRLLGQLLDSLSAVAGENVVVQDPVGRNGSWP